MHFGFQKKHKKEFPLPPIPLEPDPLLHHSNAITSAAPTGKMGTGSTYTQ